MRLGTPPRRDEIETLHGIVLEVFVVASGGPEEHVRVRRRRSRRASVAAALEGTKFELRGHADVVHCGLSPPDGASASASWDKTVTLGHRQRPRNRHAARAHRAGAMRRLRPMVEPWRRPRANGSSSARGEILLWDIAAASRAKLNVDGVSTASRSA